MMENGPDLSAIEETAREAMILREQNKALMRRVHDLALELAAAGEREARKDGTIVTLLDIIADRVAEYQTARDAAQIGIGVDKPAPLQLIKTEDKDGVDVDGLPPFED